MIIHGMLDTICLFRDSIHLAEKLMHLGKDFELVPLPASVHGEARTKDFISSHVLRKVDRHFVRHLGTGPTRPDQETQ